MVYPGTVVGIKCLLHGFQLSLIRGTGSGVSKVDHLEPKFGVETT